MPLPQGGGLLRLTPSPEQAEAIALLAGDSSSGAIVGAEIGAGKTLITVEGALDRFATRVLTVAPLAVFENWQATFAAQTDGQLELKPCGNTKYADIPAKILKANFADFMAGKDGFYFMGREFWIAQDWYTDHDDLDAKGKPRRKRRGAYDKHPVDVLIFDEAHFAADKGSRGAKSFKYQKAGYKVAVTGTFFGNKFENAYTIPNAIWGSKMTDTFELWRARFAKIEYSPHTWDNKQVVGELEPGAWVKTLPTYLFLEGHKGEVIPDSRFVDLHPSQRRVYDDLDKKYAARAESGEWILTELKVTARARLRQVAIWDIDVREGFKVKNGRKIPADEVYFPPDGKSAKYDEFKRTLQSHDEPVVVTMDFAQAAIVFTERLKHDGISAGLWAGQKWVKDEDRMLLKESFQAGRTRVLVGVPAAMGTGVDGLQRVCRRMDIISETEDGIGREQTIGRLDRRGQERPVYVTNIFARDTIDLAITQSLAMRAIDNALSREMLE